MPEKQGGTSSNRPPQELDQTFVPAKTVAAKAGPELDATFVPDSTSVPNKPVAARPAATPAPAAAPAKKSSLLGKYKLLKKLKRHRLQATHGIVKAKAKRANPLAGANQFHKPKPKKKRR